MKKVKSLLVKADDLRKKIAAHSAHLSIETPLYPQQAKTVEGWLQAHFDVVQEIAALRTSIARTNLNTEVEISIGGKVIKKSITEWILRRRELSKMDLDAWSALTDRNLREQVIPPTTPGGNPTNVTIVRYYDPKKRDDMVAMFRDEPNLIDARLEVVNATTELL